MPITQSEHIDAEFWSAAKTAETLGIGVRTLERVTSSGDIPCVPTPYGRLYVAADIEEVRKTFIPPKRGRPPKREQLELFSV